jgi:hypothetical protein
MNGYIVHTEEGFFLGAFLTYNEAVAFAYNEQQNTGNRIFVSKERKYRDKFIRQTGLENRVLDRTLQFMSR